MSFLTPLFLALGLLAFPIILLYMLKLRRKEVEISSTMLWQMVLRDRQANAPWQRLKRNLLLLLQLLILAGLVMALARPAVPMPAVASGSVVVLLDASASMQAADVEPSRFAAAKATTRELVDALETGSAMTLILVGLQPQILASHESDAGALYAALETAQPAQGEADWDAAFALAAGASDFRTAESNGTTIVIVSDGGLPESGLPPLPGEVRYLPIGESAENVGISALSLRPTAAGAEMFVRVTNYGQADRTVILSIYLEDDLLNARRLDVGAASSRSLVLPDLPGAGAVYEARLANVQSGQPLDDFSLDNAAFAVFQQPNLGRTLMISEGNLFLEQLLSALPDIVPYRALPDETGQVTLPSDPFDLYVFDGSLPEDLPVNGNLLLINPPDNPLFRVSGLTDQLENPRVFEHPLTSFVGWDNVHVMQASVVQPPMWAEVLVHTETTPLVFVGEHQGQRIAVLTFDLHVSDLPLQVTFPVLFSNIIRYLTPSQAFEAPDGLAPGEPLAIFPEASTVQVAVSSPTGEIFSPPLTENGVTFADTERLGVYAVNYFSQDAQYAEFFAVNLFSPAESAIQPAGTLQVGSSAVTQAEAAALAQREYWPWLAALALGILLLEWAVYHRREMSKS